MDQYSTEVYDLLLKMAAAFCLTNRYLDRILELAPNIGEQELMNSIAFVMEIIEENAEKVGAPRGQEENV